VSVAPWGVRVAVLGADPVHSGHADVMISKLISGGQAGADRAALDWAIAHGVPHGGWCPAGRRAEDGPLPARYRLVETASRNYRVRTACNVRDADATLIVHLGALEGGSLQTRLIAERSGKPVRVIPADIVTPAALDDLRAWLAGAGIDVLNVAGPRESRRPGIYRATGDVLDRVLRA
jgi:hypothetical protein